MRWVFSLLLFVSSIVSAKAELTALEFIKQTATDVTQSVAEHKQEIENNPASIYALIEKKILPHFDFYRMSSIAVGNKYWSKATDDQKSAFVGAFKVMLVKTYATALLTYSGEQVNYLSAHKLSDSDTSVSTLIQAADGQPIPINYRMYQKDAKWQVFDVSINNISLVSNYRRSFSRLVRRYGMDGLVKKLQAKNAG